MFDELIGMRVESKVYGGLIGSKIEARSNGDVSDMVVSYNRGTPQSSILMGFSLTKTIHFWGTHIYGNPHVSDPQQLLRSVI